MPLIDRVPARVRMVAVLLLRLLIAGVFIAAAIPKVMDPASFARDIDNYRVLPDVLVGPAAVAMPMIELVIAAALLSGIHASGAALIAMGMLVVFALAMVQAISRGIDLDCGCFGNATETRVSGLTIARNVVLALACLPIVLARPRERKAAKTAAEPAAEPTAE